MIEPRDTRLAPDPVAAAVLAGGAGSRMGGSKATAVLAGRPLIDHPLRALREAGLEPFAVTKADRPVPAGVAPVVIEPDEPRHPLLGIVTALEAAARPTVVVACDMPLLPPPFLAWLAGQSGRTVLPRVGGRLQPLAARYEASALEALAAEVGSDRPVTAAVAGLDPLIVEEDELRAWGDPRTMFLNVNTPAELASAEALIRG